MLRSSVLALCIALLFSFSCKVKTKPVTSETIPPKVDLLSTVVNKDSLVCPRNITRNIIQDGKGNMWIAAFDGAWRYDGRSFTNVIGLMSTSRFFSVIEDRKGHIWFGSIGAGAYVYDGKSFQHFNTNNGLLNNEVSWLYEDNLGQIWLGVNGGASCYDGKAFKNYILDHDSIHIDVTGLKLADVRPPNEVTSMIQDKTGKYWMSTRGNTYTYDGKSWSVFKRVGGKPFTNVRSLMQDSRGNIWLGGNDGLWRYGDKTFSQLSKHFVGNIYEDRKGNIWYSGEEAQGGKWSLYRLDPASLAAPMPEAQPIKSGEGMIFGIREDTDGQIWFGTLDGVQRFDGKSFTDFKK